MKTGWKSELSLKKKLVEGQKSKITDQKLSKKVEDQRGRWSKVEDQRSEDRG